MTPAERERAFRKAVAGELAKLPPLQAEHVRYAVQQLEAAQSRVQALIRGAATAASRAHWERVQAEIDRQLEAFRRAVTADLSLGIDAALAAGRASVTAPLAAGGAALADDLFKLNPRAIAALRSAAVDRIKDVTDNARSRIRAALAQHLVGTLRRDQAIDQVNRVLGGEARRRAMTIVDSEIGRAHAVAQYESMLQAAANGVPMRKRWQHSGKRRMPRAGHKRAHGQTVAVHETFSIFDMQTGMTEQLRFPRDPRASARNTILCGCLAVPVVDGSVLEAIDTRTGEVGRTIATVAGQPATEAATESVAARAARNRLAIQQAQERLIRATTPAAGELRMVRDADAVGVVQALAQAAVESQLKRPEYAGLAAAQVATLAGLEAQLAAIAQGEVLHVISRSGAVSASRAGSDTKVVLPPEDWPLLRGAVLTHNHPSAATLSIEDIQLAAQFGLDEIRVVTRDGIFRLRPPAGEAWPAELESFLVSDAALVLRGDLRRFNARLRQRGLSDAERRQRVAEWLVLRLAKTYRLRYSRHPR